LVLEAGLRLCSWQLRLGRKRDSRGIGRFTKD